MMAGYSRLTTSTIYIYVYVSWLLISNVTGLLTPVKVSTPKGEIQGYAEVIDGSTTIARFYGIPYALPPTSRDGGSQRWDKPQQVPSWNDTLVTEEDASTWTACLQVKTSSRKDYILSEDCLTINVYTPTPVKGTADRAVLVWIHGGGFTKGAAREYEGKFLAGRQDIVVATFNYRLDVLGYFDVDGDNLMNNAGLWDMRLALEWVQENIESFGGDRDRVTIYGGSAGGMAVTLLATSDKFNGLFHRVIGASGNFLCPKMADSKPEGYRRRFMQKFKCSDIDCLRKLDGKELVEYAREIENENLNFPVKYWFAPYIDNEIQTVDFFQIWEYLRDGQAVSEDARKKMVSKFQSYDYLGGFNTQEGSLILSTIGRLARRRGFTIEDGANKEIVEIFLKEYIGLYFPNSYETNVKLIMDLYFKNIKLDDKPSVEAAQAILDIYSDLLFTSPTLALLDSHSEQQPTSTYMYTFTHETQDSKAKNPTWFRGSRHTDERTYVFGAYPIFYGISDYNMTEQERRLSNQMMNAWGNFIKTGNPVSKDSKLEWKPYSKSRQYFYEFGEGQVDVAARMYNVRRMMSLKDRADHTIATTPSSGSNGYRVNQTFWISLLVLLLSFFL